MGQANFNQLLAQSTARFVICGRSALRPLGLTQNFHIGDLGWEIAQKHPLPANSILPTKMRTTAALLIACAFGATASAAELQVNQYEGPT